MVNICLLSQGPGLGSQFLAFSLCLFRRQPKCFMLQRYQNQGAHKAETTCPKWTEFGLQRPSHLHGLNDFLSGVCFQTMKFPESSKHFLWIKGYPLPPGLQWINPCGFLPYSCFLLESSPTTPSSPLYPTCNGCHYGWGGERKG